MYIMGGQVAIRAGLDGVLSTQGAPHSPFPHVAILRSKCLEVNNHILQTHTPSYMRANKGLIIKSCTN